MTDKDRIKQYLEYKCISKGKFYATTGLSVGFLDSGRSLGVDKARIIINSYPDINLDWLILGVGPMLRDEARQKDDKPADQDAAASDELLDRIEQQAQEIARLQGRIEAQKDFIELIISKLSKNNGGGNFGFPAIGLENSPIDRTNPSQDQADPR